MKYSRVGTILLLVSPLNCLSEYSNQVLFFRLDKAKAVLADIPTGVNVFRDSMTWKLKCCATSPTSVCKTLYSVCLLLSSLFYTLIFCLNAVSDVVSTTRNFDNLNKKSDCLSGTPTTRKVHTLVPASSHTPDTECAAFLPRHISLVAGDACAPMVCPTRTKISKMIH